MSTDETTENRSPSIRADIERTRTELGEDVNTLSNKVDPRTRARRLATATRDKATSLTHHGRAAVPQKARQAGQAVNRHRTPASAGVLVVAGAVAALVVQRRRAAKARATRSRWLPGFRHQ